MFKPENFHSPSHSTYNASHSLYYQCSSVSSLLRGTCRALADVYYAAVRAFGGGDATPGKRDDDLIKEYEDKVALYDQLVKEAQEKGLLPALD